MVSNCPHASRPVAIGSSRNLAVPSTARDRCPHCGTRAAGLSPQVGSAVHSSSTLSVGRLRARRCATLQSYCVAPRRADARGRGLARSRVLSDSVMIADRASALAPRRLTGRPSGWWRLRLALSPFVGGPMIINHGVEGSSPSALTNEIKVLWDNSGLHPDLIF